MADVILTPPRPNGATTKVNGRTYSAPVAGLVTAPDFDAAALVANGWKIVTTSFDNVDLATFLASLPTTQPASGQWWNNNGNLQQVP